MKKKEENLLKSTRFLSISHKKNSSSSYSQYNSQYIFNENWLIRISPYRHLTYIFHSLSESE